MNDAAPQELSRLRRARAAAGRAGRLVYRYARRFAVTIGVIVAVVVVSTLTIDLGPYLKARAEKAGGDFLQRKMTIGRLGVHIARGRFVVENLRIDGMFPNEPPWLEAKRLDVSLTWTALLKREILLDSIQMSDWRMIVESFPDGRQTFPRLTGPPRKPRTGSAHRRHDHAVRPRRARRVDLQRLRIGLARRGAKHGRNRHQGC